MTNKAASDLAKLNKKPRKFQTDPEAARAAGQSGWTDERRREQGERKKRYWDEYRARKQHEGEETEDASPAN